MLPQLVIFDVDGLLLDTEQVWKQAWRKTADSFGLLNVRDEEFHRLIGKTGQASMDEAREILNGACRAEDFMERMRAFGSKMLEEDLRLKPGARELLEKLQEKEISCAVATATSRELTEKRLGRMGILSFFSYVPERFGTDEMSCRQSSSSGGFSRRSRGCFSGRDSLCNGSRYDFAGRS